MRTPLVLAALTPSIALAVPGTFSHQGRLLDALGAPQNGPVSLTVELVDATATVRHTQTFAVTLEDGYYAVELAPPASVWSHPGLEVVTKVDGVEVGRQSVLTVPYAARAGAADTSQTPAFCAYNNAGGDQSTNGTFVANVEWFETGGDNYDTTTGRFTAPFAGVYAFSWDAYTNQPTGRTFFFSTIGTLSQTNGNGKAMTVLAHLDAGQQVWVGGNQYYTMTWYGTIGHNLFCGHLVSRD